MRIRFRTLNAGEIERVIPLLLFLAVIGVNLFLTASQHIVGDIELFSKRKQPSAWERRFRFQSPFVGRYIKFLKESLPPKSSILLPPRGLNFGVFADSSYMAYFLSPMQVTGADKSIMEDDVVRWVRARGVTHIAVCRGDEVYRGWERARIEAWKMAYARKVLELGLPTVYMPEFVDVRARAIEVIFQNSTIRTPLADVHGTVDMLRVTRGDLCINNLKEAVTGVGAARELHISAQYSAKDGRILPEDFRGLRVNVPAEAVKMISADIQSSSIEGGCIFAVLSYKNKRRLMRSDFNMTAGAWQRVSIRDLALGIGADPGAVIEYIGVCIRPLGWGYSIVD